MNQAFGQQRHTASYYAASINDPTRYAPLQGAARTDVCVVGGGFCGVSTALTLAERGYSVTLLEANRIGWGASGRNGGQLIHGGCGLQKLKRRHGDAIAGIVEEMKWRGNDIVRDRVQRYRIDCDLKDGFVEVATKPKMLRWLQDYADERERENTPGRWEIWNREETCERLGTDVFLGAFACYRDGHLHPLNLCLGEARAAAQLGAHICEDSAVTRIEHGKTARVVTADGHVDADAVVLCGNAYARLEPARLANLIFPAGSYIVATEPLADDVVARINPLDVAVCDLNEVVDYFRLSADGRLLYGGACNYSGRDPHSIRDYILPRLARVYPQLADVRIDFEWGGKIGIVLRRIPTVGRINGNVFYCQGFSGHGVAPTHTMSEVMADAIAGSLERFDLFASVRHPRIPGSQWLGNQIVALGMLYYKLKDKL